MVSSLPLFAELESPSHLEAFEGWVNDRRALGSLREPASVQVYRDMWGAFTAWCLGQNPRVTLKSLNALDLQAFQAARFGIKSSDLSLSPRHALRLMRLIDRVLKYQAEVLDEPPNMAVAHWLIDNPTVRYAETAATDPLPEYLSVAEAKSLITFVSAARPRPGLSQAQRDSQSSMKWQDVRNRTAVALQLGAGLTPGDVRSMLLTSPTVRGGRVRDRPWKVALEGNGNSPARETPVAPWAGELLQHWLQVRVDMRIGGEFLFPSTRAGKPWSKDSQYRSARSVLEEAGIEAADGGSFRLRHTFAIRQLRRGTAPVQVAHWLGVEPDVMERYERLVAGPAEVV